MNDLVVPEKDGTFSNTVLQYIFSLLLVGVTFKQLPSIAGINLSQLLFALVLPLIFLAAHGQWRPARPFVVAASIVCLSLLAGGACRAAVGDGGDISVRDTLAYLFTYVIVCASVTLFLSNPRTSLIALGHVISGYLLAITIAGFLPFRMVDAVWYYGVKLQGLSDNPNQIGFLAAIGLGVLSADEIMHRPPLPVKLVGAFACALAGYLSGSAAFLVAAFAAGALVLLRVLFGRRSSQSGKITASVPATLVVALLTVAILFLGSRMAKLSIWPSHVTEYFEILEKKGLRGSVAESLEEYAKADGGQGSVRLQLWTDASKLILSSPLLGLGPGQHLRAIGDPKPQEAHNTLIDILLISGLVGALPVAIIFLLILRSAFRNSRLYIVCLLVGPVLAFGMFHYIGRQPLFWIALMMAWYIAQRRSSQVRDESVATREASIA